MSIRKWIEGFVIARAIKPVVKFLDGKKSVLGAVSFLLWVAIYAMPAFGPDYNWVVSAGTTIRDALLANGITLDNSLFNAGTTLTLIGVVDKIRKYFNKDEYERDFRE